MKQMLINSMVSFTLGTGASIIGIMAWTGSTDLQEIRSSVQNYTERADQQVSALLGEYNVTVNSANAEIGAYEQALEKANGNINKLISAYEDKVDELAQAEQDLSDLQVELGKMQTRLDSQYEQDMNAIIQQANAQIENANNEVKATKEQVDTIINASGVSMFTIDDHKEHLNKLDTKGDKSVVEITDIVGE